MPQLDQFTHFTQSGWLCVFYSTLYVVLYKDGLPKISRIPKPRKQLSHDGAERNKSSIREEQDVVLKECFNTSVSFPYSSVSGASQWLHQMVKTLKTLGLLQMNTSYMCPLGEISFSQVLKEQAIDTFFFLEEGGPSYPHSPSLASSCHTVAAAALNLLIVLRGQGSTIVNINNGPVNIKSGYGKEGNTTSASSIRDNNLILGNMGRNSKPNPGPGDKKREVQCLDTPRSMLGLKPSEHVYSPISTYREETGGQQHTKSMPGEGGGLRGGRAGPFLSAVFFHYSYYYFQVTFSVT